MRNTERRYFPAVPGGGKACPAHDDQSTGVDGSPLPVSRNQLPGPAESPTASMSQLPDLAGLSPSHEDRPASPIPTHQDLPTGPTPPPLATRGLTVGYGSVPVVTGLDLEVRAGEIVALIGPNGTGKSTVLRTVTGRLAPLAGQVLISGRDLAGLSVRDRAREVAVLLTERVEGELLTCSDIVEMGRYPHMGGLGIASREDRDRVREAMELASVWDLRDREFLRLSDGQRQRVLLARAICQGTRTLVLDEPTSHLDIRYQVELVSLLRRLAHERGLAILTTLHELPLARRVADRAVCLKDGQVMEQGTREQVFRAEVIDELFDLMPGTYDARTGGLMP